MPKFIVTQTRIETVEVEAATAAEAERIASNMDQSDYEFGEISFQADEIEE